jgi:23S rRNA A2030 N6-methylase RlmJ
MVGQALRRMANVCVMIWYPVTTQAFADDFVSAMSFPGAKSVLRAELLVREPAENGGLAGSGVVIVNPPWTLHEETKTILPALAAILGEGGQGRYKLDWIVQRERQFAAIAFSSAAYSGHSAPLRVLISASSAMARSFLPARI